MKHLLVLLINLYTIEKIASGHRIKVGGIMAITECNVAKGIKAILMVTESCIRCETLRQ